MLNPGGLELSVYRPRGFFPLPVLPLLVTRLERVVPLSALIIGPGSALRNSQGRAGEFIFFMGMALSGRMGTEGALHPLGLGSGVPFSMLPRAKCLFASSPSSHAIQIPPAPSEEEQEAGGCQPCCRGGCRGHGDLGRGAQRACATGLEPGRRGGTGPRVGSDQAS